MTTLRCIPLALGLALGAGCAAEFELGTTDQALTRDEIVARGGLLPDIVEQPPAHLGIQNKQGREILRFTSTHWNVGAGKLQIRGGGQVAPCTIDGPDGPTDYPQCTHATQEILDASDQVVATLPAGVHPEHNHWHQDKVADFVLRAGALDGPPVAQSLKITYCLIDWDKLGVHPRTRTYFDCDGDVQGISPMWGDQYHHATHGQQLDVTGVPAGVYYLTHVVDPTDKWLEADEGNNLSWVKLELTRNVNAKVTVLEASPCTGVQCGSPSNR